MAEQSLLHLVLGSSVGGCLRAATYSCGLPGHVHAFEDDLSHGPLVNNGARIVYFSAFSESYWQSAEDANASLADFDNLPEKLERVAIRDICIWACENASERTFLQMACHGLRPFKGSVMRVGPTGSPFS